MRGERLRFKGTKRGELEEAFIRMEYKKLVSHVGELNKKLQSGSSTEKAKASKELVATASKWAKKYGPNRK